MLVVDLLKSERSLLAKYFTEEGVDIIHAHHGRGVRTSSAA